MAIDPDADGIHNQLSVVYFELGLPDEAIASARRFVELAPSEPNSHDTLGLIYQRAGRYQQAIESYQQAQRLNLRFEPPVIHLGNTYLQLGRYQDAIGQYQRYEEIAPSDFELQRARDALATVYWMKGDLKQAEAKLALQRPDLLNAHPFSWMIAVELGKCRRKSPSSILSAGQRQRESPAIAARGIPVESTATSRGSSS